MQDFRVEAAHSGVEELDLVVFDVRDGVVFAIRDLVGDDARGERVEEVRVGDVDEHELPPRVEEVGFLNWLESLPFGESCRHLGGP